MINRKIDNVIYDICLAWLNIIINHPLADELKTKCATVTLIGYYVGGVGDIINYCMTGIVFASIVYNSKHTIKYSRTPKYAEDFFLKYNLNYVKYDRIASGIKTTEQFMEEVSRLYKRVSESNISDQMKGKVKKYFFDMIVDYYNTK